MPIISIEESYNLSNGINDIFRDSLINNRYKSLNLQNPSEPQIVKYIIEKIPDLFNNFQFQNIHVKCGSIFVHQTPKVKCENFPKAIPKNVEIGDLLIISNIKTENNKIERYALLLQAKKYENFLPVIPDNMKQLYLYHNFKEFEYISPKFVKGMKRKFSKMWDKDGLKYLLIPDITKKHRCKNLFLTANANNPLSHYNLFVFEIICMLIGQAGRKFNYIETLSVSGGYSNVISDLLNLTQYWTNKGKSRHYGNLLFLNNLSTEKIFNINYSQTECKNYFEDEDNKGISILEFNVEID